jgi:hypothetical protein
VIAEYALVFEQTGGTEGGEGGRETERKVMPLAIGNNQDACNGYLGGRRERRREGGQEGEREGGREGGRAGHLDGHGLEFVVVGGAGAVGIDVVDLMGLHARAGQGHVHGVGETLPLGMGGGDVVGVARGAVAEGGREGGRAGGRAGGREGGR